MMYSTTECGYAATDTNSTVMAEDALPSAGFPAQEGEMAPLIADGDQAASNRMVLANLGLVIAVARKFQGRGLALDDLVGEGNLGLFRAAESFDPDFGTRISTYAVYWVEEAIRDALINRTATIRLPAYIDKALDKVGRCAKLVAPTAEIPAELRGGRFASGPFGTRAKALSKGPAHSSTHAGKLYPG